MNPCPCGWLGSLHECRCTPDLVRRYQARLSGPLLDRIDLQVEVRAVAPHELLKAPDGERSADVAERVARARAAQLERQGVPNAQLDGARLGGLEPDAEKLLQRVAAQPGWSARSVHRAWKVARTLADLAGRDGLTVVDVAEALQYRAVVG